MALYLGSGVKLKINLGNITYCLNVFSALSVIEDIILSSSDNYILQDLNGLFLIPKEIE